MSIFWIYMLGLLSMFAGMIFFILLRAGVAKQYLLVIPMVTIILSSGLYFYLGGAAQLQRYYLIEGLIVKLQMQLAQRPDNPKGWYLLGRLYATVGRSAKAEAALTKAAALSR